MGKKKANEAIDIEEIHKEMDLIQACITRMADNSFRLKELYISLITIALTVMMSQEFDRLVMGVFLLCVTLVFWGLDAFFLKMETLYRWKYEWVIAMRFNGVRDYLYDLNPHNSGMWMEPGNKKDCFARFIFSKTLKPLYGTVVGVAIVILVISGIKK